MLELCMSGQALSMLRRSALAHTMNAFIGRFMCSPPSATPPVTPPKLLLDLEPPLEDLGDLSIGNPRATGASTQNIQQSMLGNVAIRRINQSINQKRIRVTKVTNVTARPLLQC